MEAYIDGGVTGVSECGDVENNGVLSAPSLILTIA